MASVTYREKTGEREFRVPTEGALPGVPFTGGGELVLRYDSGGLPAGLTLRLRPTPFEFGAKLQKLVAGTALEARAFELAAAAREQQPIVIYDAGWDVVLRLPVGLSDLLALSTYLEGEPKIFDLTEYRFVGIEFEG